MKIVSLQNLPVSSTSHGSGVKKVMIKKDEINSLMQFAQVTFRPGEVAGEHAHDDLYEVFLIEDGIGTIKVNGNTNYIEKGNCIIVEPEEIHEISNTGTSDLKITYFEILK